METREKITQLKSFLAGKGKVIVAYSGGVDSTLLVKLCADTLGPEKVIAVTGVSQTYTEDEKQIARQVTGKLGVKHILLETDELANDKFASNPGNRCYYCKTELYSKLAEFAKEKGIPAIVDATNADDLGDYRPGRRAAAEHGIVSPFVDFGITKTEIRSLSRDYDLPTWNKPANPCLASRVPYGTRITDEILRKIEAGERVLRENGFAVVRLRHHDAIARIEITIEDFPRILEPETRERIVTALKALGYRWISLDLAGFRTGSLNAVISSADLIGQK